MPIRYSIDVRKNLVSIDATGVTVPLDWGKAFVGIKGDAKRNTGMNVCFDLRKHESALPLEAIESLSRRVEIKKAEIKWAFVISRRLSEGKVLSLAAQLEEKNVVARAFYVTRDVAEWLSKE